MSWAAHVARVGAMRKAYKSLVGKRERKRPRGRPKRKCDFWETFREKKFDWIHVAQDKAQWRF
jgi:hypothetical protein